MNEGDDDISVDENEDSAVLASPEALETSFFINKPSLVDLIGDTEETALGSDNTNVNVGGKHSVLTLFSDELSCIIKVKDMII
ncbi:unnamed protein product [Rotaria sp. Silwood1]|nr:unnamed protein product [Rotaria sp. Silwood1]